MTKSCFVFLLSGFLLSSVLFAAELVPIPTDLKVDDKKVQLGKKHLLHPTHLLTGI